MTPSWSMSPSTTEDRNDVELIYAVVAKDRTACRSGLGRNSQFGTVDVADRFARSGRAPANPVKERNTGVIQPLVYCRPPGQRRLFALALAAARRRPAGATRA